MREESLCIYIEDSTNWSKAWSNCSGQTPRTLGTLFPDPQSLHLALSLALQLLDLDQETSQEKTLKMNLALISGSALCLEPLDMGIIVSVRSNSSTATRYCNFFPKSQRIAFVRFQLEGRSSQAEQRRFLQQGRGSSVTWGALRRWRMTPPPIKNELKCCLG